jgi:hypothetical protein
MYVPDPLLYGRRDAMSPYINHNTTTQHDTTQQHNTTQHITTTQQHNTPHHNTTPAWLSRDILHAYIPYPIGTVYIYSMVYSRTTHWITRMNITLYNQVYLHVFINKYSYMCSAHWNAEGWIKITEELINHTLHSLEPYCCYTQSLEKVFR